MDRICSDATRFELYTKKIGPPLTTTAYDTGFIASDIAFTDNHDVVHLDIAFRKVKRVGGVVFGMAGCLVCMRDFTQMIVDYVTGARADLVFPPSIVNRADRDFIVMIHMAGACMMFDRRKDEPVAVQNITQIPTVIGSGSVHVKNGFDEHKNAVVAVLEAIRSDKYTDGEVKYCSVQFDEIHNLEVDPMNSTTTLQITGMQNEIKAANDYIAKPEHLGKTFRACTDVTYVGKPEQIPLDAGMSILQQGLDTVRASVMAKQN